MNLKLVFGVATGLVLALVAVAASLVVDVSYHAAADAQRASRAALETQARFNEWSRSLELLLGLSCSRDVLVERLALELAAGGTEEEDVARVAQSLSRGLQGDVWLLHERAGALTPVGSSTTWPSELPSLSELQSTLRPTVWNEVVLASCRRPIGREALWLVRVESIGELQERFTPRDPLAKFDERGSSALTVPSVDRNEAFELHVRVQDTPGLTHLGVMLPITIVMLLFGFGLIYAFVARKPVDDGVLTEIEAAAERVARGDLTTQIGKRFSGRADQTIRTFDRMTSELAEMRNKLGEAERAAAFQDIAQRIAHEIKNPLAPIQLSIETLRKAHAKHSPEFDEIFDESTRAILEEVRRMERIVREFSEFARLPKARPGLLELGALAVDTLALYEPDDVKLEVIHPEPVMVRVDREQLAQVLVNLVGNAIDAARANASPRVEVRVEPGALHVDDNGPGIAPGERERVFEPYFTTKQHGTGLGLAIVKRIVTDHGGSIRIESSPLGGARFTLRLPT